MIPDSRQILLIHSWFGTVNSEQINYKIHRYCFYGDITEFLITEYCITESCTRTCLWYSCYWYDVRN